MTTKPVKCFIFVLGMSQTYNFFQDSKNPYMYVCTGLNNELRIYACSQVLGFLLRPSDCNNDALSFICYVWQRNFTQKFTALLKVPPTISVCGEGN